MHEPLTARNRPKDDHRSAGNATGGRCGSRNGETNDGNVSNRVRRNGSRVVGDGMLGSSIEISREDCQLQNAGIDR